MIWLCLRGRSVITVFDPIRTCRSDKFDSPISSAFDLLGMGLARIMYQRPFSSRAVDDLAVFSRERATFHGPLDFLNFEHPRRERKPSGLLWGSRQHNSTSFENLLPARLWKVTQPYSLADRYSLSPVLQHSNITGPRRDHGGLPDHCRGSRPNRGGLSYFF